MADVNRARLSLRIDLPGGARLGPGKADLLEAIDAHGSLAASARALGLSYPKAKRLVDELNGAFNEALVITRHGGHERGGAALSPTGRLILALYRQVGEAAERASKAALCEFGALANPRNCD